jgi:transposase-like protein
MDAQATFSCSFTQSDLGPVVELPSLPHWPAQRLLPQERRDLAIQVLAGAETVSELAREHEVSRKFLYHQVHTAEQALNQAFAPPPTPPDKVLFYLPVTKSWLRQLVLG